MTAPWTLKTTARWLAGCWQQFFHAPCDARVCAAVRVGYATLVLVHLAVLYPNLDTWFTDSGVLPSHAARQIVSPYSWSLLGLLPGTSAVLHTFFWIMAAQAAMMLIGFLPRLNALGIFIWLVSFQTRNPFIFDGEDAAMRMIGFFLIWMPIGRCWSLNSMLVQWWLGPWPGARSQEPVVLGHRPPATGHWPLAPGWSLRLLQIEMALIYLSAALEKLQGEAWLNGTAIYYVARLNDFFGRFPVPASLFDTPWTVALMTWSVLIVELSVPLFIWFRESRRLCLLAVLLFHLANEWTMHLFLFHWIMLVGWLSFVTPDDLSWLKSIFWRAGGVSPPRPTEQLA